jgi:RNA polymerase sigma-70 factor (ECF subfamily)
MGSRQSLPDVAKSAPILAAAPPFDLAAVYEAELTHVWHSLRRFGVRRADLEDLCHDVFVAVHGARDRFDPTRPIRPWLSGIAFRVASEYRRRAHNRRELPGEPPTPPPAPGPAADERLSMQEEQDLVLAALATLSEERRAVLIMHDLDEQSMPEIAEALGWPLNTAYSRLRLARADFAAAIGRRRAARSEP